LHAAGVTVIEIKGGMRHTCPARWKRRRRRRPQGLEPRPAFVGLPIMLS
jgi:hypothetical protein